ncbi:MAG: AAA family ATPase [Candidatus Sumerlaeota bacterium]|nr:AAA family ATPase [Candidatus Sumerlaeota bacterium]
MASLTKLQDLRTILGQLNAEHPAGTGEREEQTHYYIRNAKFLERLALEIASRQGKARVLVTGQIGVGKSSELGQFFRQQIKQRNPGFLIPCNLEHNEHPERCGATGVLLTALRDCWKVSKNLRETRRDQKDISQIRDNILTSLIDWLKGNRTDIDDKVVFKFGGMDFPIPLKDKDAAVSIILGKATQHEAVSSREDRFGLAPDSLILFLNSLLNWIRQYSRQYPVIIIDHVDKIRDETAAREVLIDIIPQWKRILASVIMTAPYEFTIGQLRQSVESYWERPLIIYPVPIPEPGQRVHVIYMEIAKNCGLNALLDEGVMEMFAYYSGGILRTYVQLLIAGIKKAYLEGHDKILKQDAQSVIFEAQRAYQDYGRSELELLDRIDRDASGLGAAATLLRSPISLLVMEPEKEAQKIRVHPLAEKTLERFRMKQGQSLP